MTPCARGAHACPAATWGVRGEGQAEAVRSREDELVGVGRGGSAGVRACVPGPAGGVVQSGDGGAEKGLVPLGDYKAVNEQVEKSPSVMPNQEADMVDLSSSHFFGKSW